MIRDETTYKPPTRLFDPINPDFQVKQDALTNAPPVDINTFLPYIDPNRQVSINPDPEMYTILGRPPVKPNKTTGPVTYPITTPTEFVGYIDGQLQLFPTQEAAQAAGATQIQPNYRYQPSGQNTNPAIQSARSPMFNNRYQNLIGNSGNPTANMARNIQPQTNFISTLSNLLRQLGILK